LKERRKMMKERRREREDVIDIGYKKEEPMTVQAREA
jgi:hypothetical protein